MKEGALSLGLHGLLVGIFFFLASGTPRNQYPAHFRAAHEEFLGSFEASSSNPGVHEKKRQADAIAVSSATPHDDVRTGPESVEAYLLSVRNQIDRELTFSAPVSRRDLRTTVELHIETDGSLAKAWVIEASPDSRLDRNVLAAVERAAPFPKPSVLPSSEKIFRARLKFEFQSKRSAL